MELKKYLCSEEKGIRVQGRVSSVKKSGIPLFWTGSAVEFNINGSELWVEYTCYDLASGMNLRVEIDKFEMFRFPLEEGTHKIRIMQCFGAEDVKNVRIFREMQANGTQVTIDALYSDGVLLPLPERKYKIEVFGDSVTSGEGLAGAVSLNRWIPAVFSSRGNYGLLVADALDADWSIVSQSGWGIYADWRNNINNAIPRYYDYVCGPIKSESAKELGSLDIYDIENDKTNISVINLGGNDGGAFGNPEWIDENGVSHKLRLTEDGKKNPEDSELIINAVYNFNVNIRRRNKNTVILWCYNMLSDKVSDEILAGVNRYIADSGDGKVYTVCIPRADSSMIGARSHPGAKAHRLYADAIIARLKEIL